MLLFLQKKLGEMVSNTTSGNVCSAPMKSTSNGVFQGENPLDYALPLAILQICIVLLVTRGLAYLLKPLRQPRVIAEIIVSSFLLFLYIFAQINESIDYSILLVRGFIGTPNINLIFSIRLLGKAIGIECYNKSL